MAILKLVSRINNTVTQSIPNHIRNTASITPLLQQWYRHYDIECGCVTPSVLMHIRYRQDSELYYLADNPTSCRHDEKCELFTSRKHALLTEQETLDPITFFSPYKNAPEKTDVKITTKQVVNTKPLMSTLEKIFSTLVNNSFSNYQFGRYTSLPAFIEKIQKSNKNIEISTPWGKPLVELIYYGPKGKAFAHASVLKLQNTNKKQIPTVLWFNYAPAGTQSTGTTVSIRDTTYVAKRVTLPHKADGPYLMVCTITPDEESNSVRDILLIPIVSKDYIIPIFSDKERAAALEFFPKLFGMNNYRDFSHYLVKPVWPDFNNNSSLPVPIWTSFLLFRKSKRDGTKKFKVVSDKQVEILSEIYGTDVISLKELRAGVEW